MLGKTGIHEFESEGGADLYTLRLANAVPFTKITDKDGLLLGWIESWDLRRTSFCATPALLPEASLFIDYHMETLVVIVNDGRIQRTRFFTFPLLIGALAADILDGLGGWEKVSVDADPRQLPVDYSMMEHGACYLAIAAPDAQIPTRFNKSKSFRKG